MSASATQGGHKKVNYKRTSVEPVAAGINTGKQRLPERCVVASSQLIGDARGAAGWSQRVQAER